MLSLKQIIVPAAVLLVASTAAAWWFVHDADSGNVDLVAYGPNPAHIRFNVIRTTGTYTNEAGASAAVTVRRFAMPIVAGYCIRIEGTAGLARPGVSFTLSNVAHVQTDPLSVGKTNVQTLIADSGAADGIPVIWNASSNSSNASTPSETIENLKTTRRDPCQATQYEKY
jgi:hypothetical protein